MDLCQDRKNLSDWYLLLDESDGFELKELKNRQWGARVCSKKIANRILDSTNVFKSCSFRVATESTVVDGRHYYAIITNNRIKEK